MPMQRLEYPTNSRQRLRLDSLVLPNHRNYIFCIVEYNIKFMRLYYYNIVSVGCLHYYVVFFLGLFISFLLLLVLLCTFFCTNAIC